MGQSREGVRVPGNGADRPKTEVPDKGASLLRRVIPKPPIPARIPALTFLCAHSKNGEIH